MINKFEINSQRKYVKRGEQMAKQKNKTRRWGRIKSRMRGMLLYGPIIDAFHSRNSCSWIVQCQSQAFFYFIKDKAAELIQAV